jgi:Kef-type K+ transport system membrane component KefB
MGLQEITAFVLIDIAIIMAAARLAGRLARRLGQPAVLGEIVAGIALGPTLLGLLPGGLDRVLFPIETRPYLGVLSQVGLVLFMFIVGLELDLSLVRSRRRTALAVSTSSVLLPFCLGFLLAFLLYPRHDQPGGRHVDFAAFALFLGISMSITAFPVLARMLTERRLHRTPVGVLALACAAVDDVLAWSLLAVAVAVGEGGTVAGVLRILAPTLVYVLVMLLLVRPALRRSLVPRYRLAGRLTPDVFAIVLAGLLVSAWLTDRIGVHSIFGAFVFGAIVPREDAGLTRELLERLEQVILLLLLPLFFVVTGLQVDVRAVGWDQLWQLALILLVAMVGKLLGAAAAARLRRVPRRQAGALGVLMNARGLTELVILQVGAQLGILDKAMFTMLVIMALVTTAVTGPLLRVVYPDRMATRDIAAAERAELGEPARYTVLVVVDDPAADTDLVRLGAGLLGREGAARLVLCRFLPQPAVRLEVASGVGADLTAIAEAGQAVHRVAREAGSGGHRTDVVVRFSDDIPADIAALGETVEADVVLARRTPRRPEHAEWALATVLGAVGHHPGPIGAVTDGTADGRSCLRLAAALAMSGGIALTVVGGGTRADHRAEAAAAALRRRGVPDVVVGTADSGLAVLLLPEGVRSPDAAPGIGGPVVVRVSAGSSDRDDDLVAAVDRITVVAHGVVTGGSPTTRT